MNAFAKLPVPHLLRWLLLNTFVGFAFIALIVPGLIWSATILEKTGYRKLDLLWLLVPFGGIVLVRTQWRYCATAKYWTDNPLVRPAPVALAA